MTDILDHQQLARLSGATDEEGRRATQAIYFTLPELEGYAQRVLGELLQVVRHERGAELAMAVTGKTEVDVPGLARRSGATNEQGGRAEGVFGFIDTELQNFTQRLATSLCQVVQRELGTDAAVPVVRALWAKVGLQHG